MLHMMTCPVFLYFLVLLDSRTFPIFHVHHAHLAVVSVTPDVQKVRTLKTNKGLSCTVLHLTFRNPDSMGYSLSSALCSWQRYIRAQDELWQLVGCYTKSHIRLWCWEDCSNTDLLGSFPSGPGCLNSSVPMVHKESERSHPTWSSLHDEDKTKCWPLLSKWRRAGDAAQVGKPTEPPGLAALCNWMAVSKRSPLSPLTVIHFLWLAESERGSYRNLLSPFISFTWGKRWPWLMRCHKALPLYMRRARQAIQSCIVIRKTFWVLSYARCEAAAAMKCRYLGNSDHCQH